MDILCDKRIPISLKDKFYKTVERLAMMYRSECRAVNRMIESRMNVAENVKVDKWSD